MSARTDASEAEVAAMIGWTPGGLRCHRLLHEAAQMAQGLPEDIREIMEVVRSGPWLEPDAVAARMRDLRLVDAAVAGGGRSFVKLRRRGEQVGRSLRNGTRGVVPPRPIEGRKPVHYMIADVQAWLEQHPKIRDRDAGMAESISEVEAAGVLGIQTGTLRSFRSKAKAAQGRIAAGEAKKGDESVADRCPPWVTYGFDVRFRVQDLDAWLLRKGRVARGDVPC